jgi:hypothetical protein
MVDPGELTAAEQRVWEAFGTGTEVDFTVGDAEADDPARADDWGPERVVRAQTIVTLLLGAREAEPGRIAAVRLVGARVEGVFDVDYAELHHHLRLKSCCIVERVYMYGTDTRQVSLVDSHLRDGLDASLAVIEGNLRLGGCRIDGGLKLEGTRISGALQLDGADAVKPDGDAIFARRAEIHGDLSCRDGFTASGGVDFRGARIDGAARFDGAKLRNPGGTALYVSVAEINGLLGCDGVEAEGELRMRGARIAGGAWFGGARLHADGVALNAVGARVGDDLRFAPDFKAEGAVELSRAAVGGSLRLEGATISNPGGAALAAQSVAVIGDVHCDDGFTADGPVRLNAARVGGILSFEKAVLTTTGAFALTLARASIRELDLRTGTAPEQVDLSHAEVGILRDWPETWPATLRLDGLRYEQLADPGPAAERLRWIEREDHSAYLPDPYEQLAGYYRRIGHDDEARYILLARQRARNRTLPVPARIWGLVQDAVVGYGYRPWRAVAWLVGLLALSTVVFGLHPPVPTSTGASPPFNPLIYSLDLLLPVIDFGVGRSYAAEGGYAWLAYFLTAAGWILATTIAAGVGRAVSRN